MTGNLFVFNLLATCLKKKKKETHLACCYYISFFLKHLLQGICSNPHLFVLRISMFILVIMSFPPKNTWIACTKRQYLEFMTKNTFTKKKTWKTFFFHLLFVAAYKIRGFASFIVIYGFLFLLFSLLHFLFCSVLFVLDRWHKWQSYGKEFSYFSSFATRVNCKRI